MSESYTIGGDTLHKCDNPNWGGQTFTPKETHNLEYIDLEMRGPLVMPTPVVLVFNAGADHKPWGDYISRNRVITEQHCSFFTTGRVRFSMTPAKLYKGDKYVIIVENYPPVLGSSAYWQYDQGDAAYPGGLRISTDDSGETWTVHYNDDHIFAEFGTPPLPKPEPPPPIDNFAILDMDYIHLAIGLIILLPTATPCHLTCYYTDKKPLKHHTERTIRGLTVPWGVYFCFVGWKAVEQNEPGDTLYHTFTIPEWEFCQTKWFTFRGEVDNILSPSVGPIFEHHHPGGLPLDVILRPNAKGILCTIPTEIGDPCPDHWKNVDEEIPDEELTQLNRSPVTWYGWAYDFFKIQSLPIAPFKIARIGLTVRARRVGGVINSQMLRTGIRTYGRTYWRTPTWFVTQDWRNYSYSRASNPYTHLPWTYQEINDLEIAVDLAQGWIDDELKGCHCTQVFLTVYRTTEWTL